MVLMGFAMSVSSAMSMGPAMALSPAMLLQSLAVMFLGSTCVFSAWLLCFEGLAMNCQGSG